MAVHVRILGTDTGDSSPSLLVFFDDKRYLFNVGEGTQRFCMEHHVRLAKVDDVFLTAVNTGTVGGLGGMVLTLWDVGKRHMNIHGPPGTANFMHAARAFISRPGLGLDVFEHGADAPLYDDRHLRVQSVLLSPRVASRKRKLEGGAPHVLPAISPTGRFAFLRVHALAQRRTQPPVTLTVYPVAPPAADAASAEAAADAAACALECGAPPVVDGAARDSAAFLSDPAPAHSVLCYICQTPDVKGKFFPQQALALGVPKGPLFGQLDRGVAVTLPDGRVVTPEQVRAPSIPGPRFAVISCPSPAYIEALRDAEAFRQLQQGGGDGSGGGGGGGGGAAAAAAAAAAAEVALLVHLAPANVLEDARYRRWMRAFGERTQHVLVNEHCCPHNVVFPAHAEATARLHALCPALFALPDQQPPPLPPPSSPPSSPSPPPPLEEDGEPGALPERCVAAHNLLAFQLTPPARQGLQSSAALQPLRTDAAALAETVRAALEAVPGLAAALERVGAARDKAGAAPLDLAAAGDSDALFLGTGSALPSKHRNVSAIMLRLRSPEQPHPVNVLLDAGEGTLGQLRRVAGCAAGGLRAELKRLRLIWISHMHADHHLGLLRLLAQRREVWPAMAPPLVVGPPELLQWLEEYSAVDSTVCGSYTFLTSHELLAAHAPAQRLVQQAVGFPLLLTNVPVVHCPNAFAAVLDWRLRGVDGGGHGGGGHGGDAFRLVYSGDTRPCKALVEAGRGATLLIHEATLESGMVADAVHKRHSTVAEAMEVARQMAAYRVILTHFSQRYPGVTPSTATAEAAAAAAGEGVADEAGGEVALERSPDELPMPWPEGRAHLTRPLEAAACDFMHVRLRDLPWLPASYELVQLALASCDDSEDEAGSEGDGEGAAGVAAQAGRG